MVDFGPPGVVDFDAGAGLQRHLGPVRIAADFFLQAGNGGVGIGMVIASKPS